MPSDPLASFTPPVREWFARSFEARPLVREPARRGGPTITYRGETYRVCGAEIMGRGQGADNRTTYWCPSCQG